MIENNQRQNNGSGCTSTKGIGTKLMFLMLGGTIGAGIALLFAPKPGKNLRQDIADAAVKGYGETLETATQVKDKTVEYYEMAKEKGAEVFDVVTEKVTAFNEEVSDDAAKIGAIVHGAANRIADSVKSRQIF